MMRPNLFLLFLLIHFSLTAQMEWLYMQGSPDNDEAMHVLTDSDNNLYVIGTVQTTMDMDPGMGQELYNGMNSHHMFIQKLTPNRDLIWYRIVDGAYPHDATISNNDEIYIVGRHYGSLSYPGESGMITLPSSTSSDGFALKMDITGNFNWGKSIYGDDIDEVNAVICDDLGNIYMIGSYRENIDLDPSSGQAILNMDPSAFQGMSSFFTQWDSYGNYQWGHHFENTDNQGKDILVDSDYNFYVLGVFKDSLNTDLGSGADFIYSNTPAHYIVKYDSTRNVLWHRNGDGESIPFSSAVSIFNQGAVDFDDNVYVAGYYKGVQDFSYGDSTQALIDTSYTTSLFLEKLDENGDQIWIHLFKNDNTHLDQIHDVKISATGGLYITGEFVDSINFDPFGTNGIIDEDEAILFLNKYDLNGNFIWTEYLHGFCSDNIGRSIAIDSDENVYGCGIVSNYIYDLDHNPLNAQGIDGVVFKIGGTATITNPSSASVISFYPNPVESILYFSNKLNGTIKLHDLRGQCLLEKIVQDFDQLNMENLSSGTYIFSIQNEKGLSTKKVVKK